MSHYRTALVNDLKAPGRNSLVGGPFGSDLTSRDYVADGVPVVRGANLGHGRWIGGEFVYVTKSKADSLAANCAAPGDLIFTQRGTLGQVALVPAEGPKKYLVSQSQMKLTVNPARADAMYLYYVFTSAAMIRYLSVNAIQTGVPHINLGILKTTEVPLPPLDEQRAIAATLGALDDKIESNRRLAAGISDLMEALIEQALHEDRRKLSVSNLGAFVNGGAYTKGASGAGRIVIRIAELNKGPGPSTVYNDIDVPEDKTARFGDILMSWSGSLGVYKWTREEAIINQHIFKVIPGTYPAWLVFDRLNAAIEVFRGIAKDKATTMGHIQRSHLETTFVDVPTDSAIKVLDDDLGPLWDRLLVAERESLKLADLRDTLLPALLSGTVRVCDENDSMTSAEVEGER